MLREKWSCVKIFDRQFFIRQLTRRFKDSRGYRGFFATDKQDVYRAWNFNQFLIKC